MSLSWRARLALTVGCWLATVALMAMMDLSPQPVLLAGIAAVFASALCLILDLSDIATPAAWGGSYEAEDVRGGTDTRLRTVHRDLLTGPTLDQALALHRLLVDLTDERLSAAHGIDRRNAPARAADVMGPELTRFVTTPPSMRELRDPQFLSTTVSRIESIRNEPS